MVGVGLQTGLRALLTNQFVLETIGHNIANVGTPGYSRQEVGLSAAQPLNVRGMLVGNGVDASSVRRHVDALLQRRILSQVTTSGRLDALLNSMTELEALSGEPDGETLGARLDGFFSAVSQLSTASSDPILRTGMVTSAIDLAGMFQGFDGGLTQLRDDVVREIGTRVDEVNNLGGRIAALNVEISAAQAAGLSSGDLMDARDLAIENLAELVDLETVDNGDGTLRVLVGGQVLVGSREANRMSTALDANKDPRLQIEGATGYVDAHGGSLGGLLSLAHDFVPGFGGRLDQLAHQLALTVNRVHSTGIPASGPFKELTGTGRLVDLDLDGMRTDELLANAGLPFDVQAGSLFLNVTEEATGSIEKHRVDITTTHTTVQDLLDDLNAVPHLAADIDAFGRLQVVADAGFGFDFSRKLDPNPDESGVFGGDRASIGTPIQEPFFLSGGETLDLSVGASSFTVTLQASDFEDPTQATAAELAAAINADPAVSTAGLVASASGGTLALQTIGGGTTASFTLDGGSALASLGWAPLAGNTFNGHDHAVEVEIGGVYTGSTNDLYTFRPTSDGTVGTTAGLEVEVFDSSGNRVATLDLGPGYVPGTELEVAEGVNVKFGLGELSQTEGDSFSVDVLADSDQTDVLVALGLNSFFTGSTAEDLAVADDIARDPELVAASLNGSSGDGAILLDLVDVEGINVAELGGSTLSEFYGETIGEMGFEISTARNAREANSALRESLELRRDNVSGVNIDEELVDLLQFEQSFAAVSRYMTVINQLNDELLQLV